ncbi:hypothetical protein FQN54_002776 [Arachnomyces sp. PD_36]|nr:hypothetical protein FQN54_002776 [Arachnomyces sp. PD_36]
MPPRGFTNPAPKTDSARSALTSFHCDLCNKSYSRHPEYEAHVSSYDHQHKKRLKDLKVLSRDPNAAERARKAEKKADIEAGLRVVDSGADGGVKRGGGNSGNGGGGGSGNASGGFKKGGFKSSFTKIGAPAGTGSTGSGSGAAVVKNVLGGDDEDDDETTIGTATTGKGRGSRSKSRGEDIDREVESDTDEEYGADHDGGGYYNPRRPTDCFPVCAGGNHVAMA